MSAYINDLAAADERKLHQLKYNQNTFLLLFCNGGYNLFGGFGA